MNITADTNVLVRALIGDHPGQAAAARAILSSAERVAIPSPVLCELVWVLRQGYKIPLADIRAAIRKLIDSDNVAVDHPTVEAGLAVMAAGADFADGVIALEGARQGGDTFVSFDRTATKHLAAHGIATKALT